MNPSLALIPDVRVPLTVRQLSLAVRPSAWPEEQTHYADYAQWWRQPAILQSIGPALANLFADEAPTVVMGTVAHGSLLGHLAANHLGVGLPEVRKGAREARMTTRGSPA